MLWYYGFMLMPLCVGIVLVAEVLILVLVSEVLVLVLVLEATVLATSLLVIITDSHTWGCVEPDENVRYRFYKN